MAGTSLPALCGGRLDYAAQAAVVLWRALWKVTTAGGVRPAEDRGTVLVSRAELERQIEAGLTESPRFFATLPAGQLLQIRQVLLGRYSESRVLTDLPQLRAAIPEFNLFRLAASLLAGEAPAHDLEYLAGRELRRSHGIALSAATIEAFQSYTARVREWFEKGWGGPILLRGTLLPLLQKSRQELPEGQAMPVSPEQYFELTAGIGWIEPGQESGEIEVRAADFDAEILTNRYFSLCTQIPGFDAMFSASGLLLVDAQPGVGSPEDAPPAQPIGGRTVLVTGPYGSGKSTLTLQMALEVAGKGGVALVVNMEQTPEECRCALESLGVPTHSSRFRVLDDIRDAFPVLMEAHSGQGAVVFLPLPGGPIEAFTKAVHDRLNWMQQYPLRLLVIDPINSAIQEESRFLCRRQLVELFQEAKSKGINIWLTCERNGDGGGERTPFEENIADTVLDLDIDRRHNHPRRSIEVKKSRLQREEPGRHSMLLLAGRGVRIYPSSVAVARAARHTAAPFPARQPFRFGVPGLDRILGPCSVFQGDLIAFHGPAGSSRTLTGVHFLLASEEDRSQAAPRSSCLLVADADETKMQSLLELIVPPRDTYTPSKAADILLCPILPGWIEPGQVLQWISDRFEQARAAGRPITRALLIDLGRWAASMPLIAEDLVFGTALIGLLRKSGATSVLLTSPGGDAEGMGLINLIAGNADCVFEFERLDFRGQTRQFVRVTRTHDMAHRRDSFELIVDPGGVRVEPSGALLRKTNSGAVRSIKIRLFVHADSPRHQEFNDRLVGAIEKSLAETVIEDQWSHYDPSIFRLSAASAIDELHILQLDEFQLPSPTDPESWRGLVKFPLSKDDGTLSGINEHLERFRQRVVCSNGQASVAVPFYENISLLAWDRSRLGCEMPESLPAREAWEWLRDRAVAWEKEPGRVFFSCPLAHADTDETYNCFFLELLQAYLGQPPQMTCQLEAWLRDPSAKRAARVFRDLCSRSHNEEIEYFRRKTTSQNRHPLRTFEELADRRDKGPIVWRHWYNTLSQMIWDLPSEHAHIGVRPIFGDITTAGEWYLAVPAYSAAPELGWEIIQLLTSPQRELQRIYRGVGLPTRSTFYGRAGEDLVSPLTSPFFHLSRERLGRLVRGAFQRSRFACYQYISETLSAHLHRILEIPGLDGGSSEDIGREIDAVMDHLADSIVYVQATNVCRRCGRTDKL